MRNALLILLLAVNLEGASGEQSRSVWIWGGWKIVLEEPKRQALLDFCAKPLSGAPPIQTLYIDLPSVQLGREESRPQIAAFVKEAHARGLQVHLLAGSTEMAYQVGAGTGVIDKLAAYNAAVPDESKFDGLHFDIEPHTMGVVWTQDNRLRDRFIDSMKKYRQRFDEVRGKMTLGLDVPTGYADDPGLIEALIDSTDYLALMDYHDRAGIILAGAEETMNRARAKGKTVVIGIELQKPNKKYGVTPMLTFWDEGSEKMEKVLSEVHEALKSDPAYAGIAVHHYTAYTELTPGPQVIVDNRKFPELPAVTAKRFASAPKIDGDLAEWSAAAVEIRDAKEVVYGKNSWKSAQDLSASARIGWDENNFYFAIDVIDDRVVQPFETRKMVNGDHIELWLDLDPEKNKSSGVPGEGVWQIGLSPGNFGDVAPGVTDWVPGGVLNKHAAEIEIKSSKSEKGYRIEARIPWTVLGRFKPGDGVKFGVNIDPSDTDGAEKPFQETLMSTSPHREWGNPKTFRPGVFQQ